MLTRFRALVVVFALLGVAAAGACAGAPHDGAADGDAAWAEVAESQFVSMAESFGNEADFGSAAYFVTSGSLDLRMFGGTIATTAEEMALALEYFLTGPSGDRGEIALEDLYLSADGAIGSYRLFGDGDPILAWAALYAIEDTQIAGRVFSYEFTVGPPPFTPLLKEGAELYDRYLAAWSRPDPETIAAVYAPNAIVVDTLADRTWSGRDDIIAGIEGDTQSTLEPGPWPKLLSFYLDGWSELLAIVQTAGACPTREARRWLLQDDLIVEDVRYRHVPSARRCGLDLDDGWWASFDPPDRDRGVSNLKTAIDGDVVEIVNAEWEQMEFVRWAFGQFSVGLDRPDVSVVWFPPSVDCGSDGSFARRQDERFDGGHSVTFCLNDDELLSRRTGSRWLPNAARLGLHEFAHVWMYDHLTDADRTVFVNIAGVDAWRDDEWGASGAERAAETIAWGLSGDEYAIYDIEPRPSCVELTARYELLTGRTPLTTCTGSRGG